MLGMQPISTKGMLNKNHSILAIKFLKDWFYVCQSEDLILPKIQISTGLRPFESNIDNEEFWLGMKMIIKFSK